MSVSGVTVCERGRGEGGGETKTRERERERERESRERKQRDRESGGRKRAATACAMILFEVNLVYCTFVPLDFITATYTQFTVPTFTFDYKLDLNSP